MRRTLVFGAVLSAVLSAAPAMAWWDGGHMQIAAVAYSKLSPQARAKADALIKLNPDYAGWVAGVSDDKKAQYAFVHAAVWADDIKDPAHGYTKDDDTPTGQNIGYADKNMHRYWHFKDVRFSTDGTQFVDADPINAVSQIKLFVAALPTSSGASDDLRSYDMVWLLHLIGDIHQPLHATERMSAINPDGDRGGNEVNVMPATGETIDLHGYWDRMFGGYVSVPGAIFDANDKGGISKLQVDSVKAKILDPDVWTHESFVLGKKFAYEEPVLSENTVAVLTRTYETDARNIARTQAALAAARLANVLNDAFK
ncbi:MULTISPECIES: S1/P1 nuclease [unclassified Mesorhizobium]|uniref:S1/P1 nuclease n=1 Tax=unclassified Mesorhizobium TaxID=325217 RepID=UPI000FCB8240|nr:MULTISPECIES: S1/P1 nuclease [unclassified Mesorhizobium]RUV99084.1 phospholipase [Mesorhizobium sp. M1A.F.Ca.IN.020.04.1.1]RUW07666.1 phospholipase [Mesorhizobium sp. M1A.F.Ca.IN.020.03.1.1]